MAVQAMKHQDENVDIIISDDEFDSLLATIPLPGFPSPHQSSSANQLRKRRAESDTPATTKDDHDDKNTQDQAYEALNFGEIPKYMANKRKKLKLQESALRESELGNSIRPQIFSGLVIHVNGHTNPPLSEIRSLIILHGGTYMAYLDHKSALTHIVASSLTPKKREEFRAYRVVKPEWIVHCVSVGRLLNWSDFGLMGGILSLEPKIAEGEATGGRAIAQKNLFDLARGLSTQTSIQITRPAQTPSHHPSPLSRKSSAPKRTTPTVASSIQSTLKSIPTRSAIIENTRKEPSLDDSTPILGIAPSLSTLSPSKDQSNNSESSGQQFKEKTEAQVDSGIFETNVEVPNLGSISCSDPSFIKTYFQQSRLHHLSTWKAELLQRVSILSENKKPTAKTSVVSAKKLKGDASDKRVIMHVDFDCFFISAGLIGQPELKGKPLAVCHAKATNSAKPNGSTSEIASCSYEARAFGVRNGQTLGRAKELCPEIQTIAYDFKLYEDLSFKFYNILLSYADELQAVSVDECLIDVSSRFTNQYPPGNFNSIKSSALSLAEEIRTTVRNATQCEVSIGISYNVLLAKLATKKAKPCGSYFLDPNQAHPLLKDLSIDDLPGFGWAQKNEVHSKLLVDNVAELQAFPLSRLVDVLGPSRGKTLHQYAHGIDDRTLKSSNHERKSVSAVINYGIRFKAIEDGGNDDARDFLRHLGLEVSRRLTEVGVSGLQLTLKIMKRAPNAPVETKKYMGHGICEEFSKTTKLSGPGGIGVSDGTIIGNEAWKLLQSMSIPPEDLRGIGIQINRLEKLTKNTHGDKPSGQSTLMFQTTKAIEPSARRQGPRHQSKVLHGSNKTIPNYGDRTPVASTSKKISKAPDLPHSTPFSIPPASQIDLEVVEALPTPLKSHILKSIGAGQSKSANLSPDQQNTIDLVTPDGKSKESTNQFGLPSVSQVDWKILAELPSSVRKPIEAIYAQQKSCRHLPPPTPPNFTRDLKGDHRKLNGRIPASSQKKDRLAGLQLAFQDQRVSRPKSKINHRVAPLGPSQKLINKKTFKLITRNQPAKISPPKKKRSREEGATELLPTPNRISDEQLEALEIDVRFFRELKGNSTRAFQLDLIWNQFQIHSSRFKEVTRQGDRWRKWRKNFDLPAKVLQISLPEPPCLFGRGGGRSGRKGLSKLEDVIELIEQWMLSSVSSPSATVATSEEQPAALNLVEIDERDLEIIEKFLLDLIDPPPNPNFSTGQQSSPGQDLEKVFKIIQWWEDLILKHFSIDQSHNPPFVYWKNILDNLKLKVNSVACRDFGAPIY
ncbi:hypothetical protein PtB15_11B198 [Puccinia triticina]|nr:hypothetical protein PtB15_11B198 [Puccinia triticina]